MQAITVRTNPQDIEIIHAEAQEMISNVHEVNNTLDTLDPILDRLEKELDSYNYKANKARKKLNNIMARL